MRRLTRYVAPSPGKTRFPVGFWNHVPQTVCFLEKTVDKAQKYRNNFGEATGGVSHGSVPGSMKDREMMADCAFDMSYNT